MSNRFGLPYLGFGLGLRFPHHEQIMRERPPVGWWEIISENFMEAHAGYWEFLADLRTTYPIVLHGVGLSIGSTDPLNQDYLTNLTKLADFLQVPWVSDHLCWTGVAGITSHDLLPVPYTEEALRLIVDRIRAVQDRLGRPLLLENPSSYVAFRASSMPEWEFLARMAEEADCALLLDVNNVYVSAFNHGFDAKRYMDHLPADRIIQIHLAGHQNYGTHIIDTHDHPVIDAVWELYAYAMKRLGLVSTMIEWDDQIPDFQTLFDEMEKARHYAQNALKRPLTLAAVA